MKKRKKGFGKCKFCRERYKKKKYVQKFCSNKCRNDFHQKVRKNGVRIKERGKIGAMSELLVCANLLNNGFEVFRSISQSCSCDLICMKNDETYRVEVKTARIYENGTLHYPGVNWSKFDLLALVVGKKIFYRHDEKIIKIKELE